MNIYVFYELASFLIFREFILIILFKLHIYIFFNYYKKFKKKKKKKKKKNIKKRYE